MQSYGLIVNKFQWFFYSFTYSYLEDTKEVFQRRFPNILFSRSKVQESLMSCL
jgi:hypothetical protein